MIEDLLSETKNQGQMREQLRLHTFQAITLVITESVTDVSTKMWIKPAEAYT